MFPKMFRRKRTTTDFSDEIQAHIELEIERLREQGLSEEAAQAAAHRQFGSARRARETSYESHRWMWWDHLAQDVRFGLRTLRRSPGFTAVAILTLALGIGANAAIFSMVNALILRSLPYPQPQQLYAINENVPQLAGQVGWGEWFPVNAANFQLWQGRCPAIDSMALIGPITLNMTGQGIPRQLSAVRVSANFFALMEIQPQLGRGFLPEEDTGGRDHEVILTAQFWRAVFNADPEIVGKSIVLDSNPYIVVGVAPDSFRFPEIPHHGITAPDVFKPVGIQPWESWAGIGGFNYDVIARLKPGATGKEALAQLNVVEEGIAARGDAHRRIAPGQFDLRAEVRPLQTVVLGEAQRALWTLLVAAGFVLLMICVNLANLMLVRNVSRAHEIAVRSALGASRRRLMRQFFLEGLLLASAGGAAGLLFANAALRVLVANAPFSIAGLSGIHMDARVLLFAVVITIATAVLFALLPTTRLAQASPLEALGSSIRVASSNPQSIRVRSGLVVSQIALCAVLLSGALLLIESLVHVQRANRWMDEQHVLAVELSLPPSEDSVQRADQFFSNVLERTRALPGVQNAGVTSKLPLLGDSYGDDIEFRELPRSGATREVGQYRFVSPGYFQTIGLPLISGRLLSDADRDKDVALISESVAQKLLPGRDPVGMHLLWSDNGPEKPREIIGVVADARNASDQFPLLTAYLPSWTYYQSSETLVVRTAIDPVAAAASVRQAIWSVDPDVAIPRERTLDIVVATSEAARRYESFLGALFAGFAVLLAAIGLYGVISYAVGQRTHEIGIRMALGAQRGDVMRLVVGNGIRLALLGVAVGILAAFGLTRSMASLLFGVTATDPFTFSAVAITLVAVALAACYIPARRAMRVDPMVALRYE
jgi:predicted permease